MSDKREIRWAEWGRGLERERERKRENRACKGKERRDGGKE
jgi:hypothetical protein